VLALRNRSIVIVVAFLALLVWAALIVYMQRQSPTVVSQFVFVVMFGLAVICSIVPVSYALNARFAPSLGRVGEMNRAVRQGLRAGLVGGVLMALHLMRMLPPERALVLVAIVVLLELLFYIRRR
jgi:thiamine transporter ThiT